VRVKVASGVTACEGRTECPMYLFICTRQRLTSPAIDYHLSSTRHWAATVRNPLWRLQNAADKREKQYSCSASPNLQRLQHITTISNLSDAHVCSRAALYHLACVDCEAWPLPPRPFPGGGYGGSRYLFRSEMLGSTHRSIGVNRQRS
jgi:hypothetical protein